MNDLKNKVAVVTGGGGGIGRAVAVRLAKEKAVVALLGGNDGQKLKTTAKTVEEAGTECIVVGGDLTEEGFLRAGIEKIVAEAGGVDILVNNAGMAYNAKFEDTGEEIFDRIMRINVKVPYFLTQAALPYLRRSKAASVINISSVVGHAGYPLQSAYAASKHAVLGFTKSLAAEVYGEGIRVHAISPGGRLYGHGQSRPSRPFARRNDLARRDRGDRPVFPCQPRQRRRRRDPRPSRQ